MSDFINQKYPLGPAVECYRAYPPDETTDPDITHFAHYFADKLERTGTERPIDALTFTMLASLAVGDLQQGRDGFIGQDIPDHPLAAREPAVYDKIYAAVPQLAEEGFSVPFGTVVRHELVRLGLLGGSQEATLDATEIITEPITDITTARTKIIEDSRQRVLAHDWQGLGVQPDLADNEFTYAYACGMWLRQAPIKSPICALKEDAEDDLASIAALPENRKQELRPGIWLALTETTIPSEYATAIRDLLHIQMIELVSVAAGLDRESAGFRFGSDVNGPLHRATTRFTEFMVQNPDMIKRLY